MTVGKIFTYTKSSIFCNVPHLQHVTLPGPIGPNKHIKPRPELKFGIGKNSEIL